ncbi:hypothetical protein HBI56_000170 [Parastagonospora nodorum]|uniref:Uncharacterized protein n=1 Tax=Phaeosphaeria nodorum (strain SN15 / ATCC MYA-4574 / FGSC 10173) TaxID=321614 RepID=A0A7U2HV85_PHANO|nr:hypothetical protein HBH56_140910 [Parastagonospora nodorum]QRC91589.1 hypothetical protein JI435_010890 [Parastagonospora nodorum SN15]KAH3928118.1 hypothetical protein HBH54_146050 [Parastagonospora nodorum]KAH3972428.1 hypothetical protein HBH52_149200 [Parastagonospora nodorum]KAH3990895.1 hypothetical protein HBI10_241970 [Parastagonospora nodorum]
MGHRTHPIIDQRSPREKSTCACAPHRTYCAPHLNLSPNGNFRDRRCLPRKWRQRRETQQRDNLGNYLWYLDKQLGSNSLAFVDASVRGPISVS